MGYFRETRNIELSTLEFIEGQINASWTGINFVKSFKSAYETDIPVVCVRLFDTASDKKEIGSSDLNHEHSIAIDVFARSDGQRLDLVDFIIETIKTGWIYYEYSHSSGNPEVLDKTSTGYVRFIRVISNRKLEFGDNVDSHDKYRQSITILVERRT